MIFAFYVTENLFCWEEQWHRDILVRTFDIHFPVNGQISGHLHSLRIGCCRDLKNPFPRRTTDGLYLTFNKPVSKVSFLYVCLADRSIPEFNSKSSYYEENWFIRTGGFKNLIQRKLLLADAHYNIQYLTMTCEGRTRDVRSWVPPTYQNDTERNRRLSL